MLIVQYPMQFSATHVQHRIAQVNVGSTNTTRVHAFHVLYIRIESFNVVADLKVTVFIRRCSEVIRRNIFSMLSDRRKHR